MSKTFGTRGLIIITVTLLAVLGCMASPWILGYVGFGVMELGMELSIEYRKNVMQPVITALESYKHDKGTYPDSIKSLERNGYIKLNPETGSESGFHYKLLNSGKYTLCFGTDLSMYDNPANDDCELECYSSDLKKWKAGSDKYNPWTNTGNVNCQ
jgi:hypothetical protein